MIVYRDSWVILGCLGARMVSAFQAITRGFCDFVGKKNIRGVR